MENNTSNPFAPRTVEWKKWLAGYTSWTPTAEPANPNDVPFMEGFRAAARRHHLKREIVALG